MSLYQKINVVGTSGSGKSVFSRQLAEKLALPYIEMDELFWLPNWTEPNYECFIEQVSQAITTTSWVLDGNYSRTNHVKWANVNTIIWLDYSFTRTLFQAFKRALKRILSQQEIWPNTGNIETFGKTFFSKESILLWTITSYHANRKKYLAFMNNKEYQHINFVRLTSPKKARQFIRAVSENC